MELASLTEPDLIFTQLEAPDGATLLRGLAQKIVEQGYVDDADKLYQRLLEREQLGSTGVGSGIAIPHCKMAGISRGILALGLTKTGIDFGAIDQQPVRLFFVVISPSDLPAAHLQCLAAISKWVKAKENVRRLLTLEDPQAIYQTLQGGD